MTVRLLALVLAFAGAACVDGTTPNCTSVDSGCFPEDSGGTVNDASSVDGDANNASDTAKPDGPTPVTDAATD
jgi:hypothetical protein